MARDTKERILNVAERLFADRGFPATSLRDLTSEAGVNIASVNYHFGSKDALLAAVLKRRLQPVNERRLALLNELELSAGDEGPELEDVLRAFIAPPFQKKLEWGDKGRNFLRLVGRIHSETNEEFRASFIQQFDTVFKRFTHALQRTLPHLDSAELTWRMFFLVGAMAHTMLWSDSVSHLARSTSHQPEDLLESLIQFATAGMSSTIPMTASVRAGYEREQS